ncbi:MAG: outer membrane protein assembly factor [Syntrophorhabdus sp.]|nr:outer membrane protein assembly factor [Syntrophorhabdus sp.]
MPRFGLFPVPLIVLCVFLLVPSLLLAQGEVRVTVEGVQGEELDNVRVALTVPTGLVKDGVVNERWLRRFEAQIPEKARQALEPFGFYGAAVTVSSEVSGQGAHEVRVLIDPGEPVRVASVNVAVTGAGSREEKLAEVIPAFPLREGATLRHDLYENGKNDIRKKALELGYLDAGFTTHEIHVDPGKRTATIELVLKTGELYYFGETEFSGAPEYPRSFFGRYLEFKPGDVFSHQKIALTQRNLINADRFRTVIIDADKDKARDRRVPIEIRLRPSKPKRLRLGGGYETDIGPKGSIKYEDVNFLGTSHKFQSQFDLSQPLQVIGARYTMPDTRDIRSFSSISFNMKREDQTTGTSLFSESIMAEFEKARTLGQVPVGSLFLQVLRERSDVGLQRTNTFSVLPGARLSGMSYDDMIRPTRGYRYSTELKGTHQEIGSSTGLIQFTGDGGVVVPLPGRLSLLARSMVGATFQNEPDADLPIALRFFAGGDRSVRGYAYKSLGPEDADGEVVGGKNVFTGSLELERAVGSDWGVAAFYDVGNAFNDFRNMQLVQGAGMGVRYYSPIGPIKLDIARQIGVRDPDFRIHISIGFGL